jgi:uncharacterized protein YeeX (DUF496 family)
MEKLKMPMVMVSTMMTMREWVHRIWRRWLEWRRKREDKTQKGVDEKLTIEELNNVMKWVHQKICINIIEIKICWFYYKFC